MVKDTYLLIFLSSSYLFLLLFTIGGIAILIYLFIVVIFFFTYFFFFGQHLRGWKLILYIPTWIVFFLFIGFKSKLLRKYDTNPGTVFAGAEIAAAQVV